MVADLKSRGEEFSGAALSAKRMQRHHCEHPPSTSAHDCLELLIEHRTRQSIYNCVAVQEPRLRAHLRLRGGVPLVYITHNSLILEPINDTSKTKADQLFHKHVQAEIAQLKPTVVTSDKEAQVKKVAGTIDSNNNNNNSDNNNGAAADSNSAGNQPQIRSASNLKKRKARAPNPLSVKKKRKVTNQVCANFIYIIFVFLYLNLSGHTSNSNKSE